MPKGIFTRTEKHKELSRQHMIARNKSEHAREVSSRNGKIWGPKNITKYNKSEKHRELARTSRIIFNGSEKNRNKPAPKNLIAYTQTEKCKENGRKQIIIRNKSAKGRETSRKHMTEYMRSDAGRE